MKTITNTEMPSDADFETAKKVKEYERTALPRPKVSVTFDPATKKWWVTYEFNDADGAPVDSDPREFSTKDEAFAFAESFDFESPTDFHTRQSNQQN